jgi:chemotaxis methyl-accepting protein methylase
MLLTPDLVAIGGSTGGPKALIEIFSQSVRVFPFPIVIINHFPKGDFTATYTKEFSEKTGIYMQEIVDGEYVESGKVYLCPGGYHLTLKKLHTGIKFKIGDDSPIDGCKPSIDKFFNSVSTLELRSIWGIILTGMGHDGLKGATSLKNKGYKVFSQEKKSCTIYGMPQVIERANLSDKVLTPREIAKELGSSPKSKHASITKSDHFAIGKISQKNPGLDSREKVLEKPKAYVGPKIKTLSTRSLEVLRKKPSQSQDDHQKGLTTIEKQLLVDFIYKTTGNITYSNGKEYLLIEKVSNLMSLYEFNNFTNFFSALKSKRELLDEFVSSMTIHESYFFRDHYPYRYLVENLFSSWETSKNVKNIWSSACAEGQEIYSIIFCFNKYLEDTSRSSLKWNSIKFYASDISKQSVDFSKEARYTQSHIRRGLKRDQVSQYFTKQRDDYIINEEFRSIPKFLVKNLLDPLNNMPKMDCIFCRYTLIYLDEKLQSEILESLAKQLRPGGILILDSAMSLRVKSNLLTSFKFERFVLFQRNS